LLHELAVESALARSLDKGRLEHTLTQAFSRCWLDYCNAVSAETTDAGIKPLQSVQKTVARFGVLS